MLEILTSPITSNGTGFVETPELPGGVTPTVTTVVTSSSIPEGSSNTDTATVTGDAASGSPTGTVSFYECGPTAAPEPCTSQGNPVGGQQGLTAGGANTATATSPSFTPTATGYWCFAAYYSGDTNYAVSSDTSVTECFDVTTTSRTITCTSLTGNVNGSGNLKGCNGNTGTKSDKFGTSTFVEGGTLTWKNGKTTTIGAATTSTGTACPAGSADEIFSGTVTADTTKSAKVGGPYNAEVCDSSTGALSLAPGTTATFF